MTGFTETAYNVFAPTDAGGEPRSVENADAQRWGTEIERLLIALIAAAGDLDLPNLLIRYTVTGGTANAITATPNLPVPTGPGLALFSILVLQENTGPVTINGKPLRTNTGNNLVAGGLSAGGIYLFLDNGDHYRLLTDEVSSAIVAAAEAAAAAAEQAANEVAADDRLFNYGTVAIVEAANVPASQDIIRVAGYSAEGDGGAALYKRVVSEPSHPGKIQSADGAWWEIAEPILDPAMFGATYNGVTNDAAAVNNAFTAADALGHTAVKSKSGTLLLGAHVNFRDIDFVGERTIVNPNGFETRNVAALQNVVILDRRQDKPFRSPPVIRSGGMKIIFGTSADRFFVATPGPRGGTLIEFNKGNVVAPSVPDNSVNGSWDLWRTGIVRMIERGGCFVRRKTGTETGAWSDFTPATSVITPSAQTVDAALNLTARRSQVVGNTISFPVAADARGFVRVGFYTSGTSSAAQQIKINGVVAKTVDLTVVPGNLLIVDVPCPPGVSHMLSLEHPGDASNLYVFGANIFMLQEDFYHVRDVVDHLACYAFSPLYVGSRGASDYAFFGKTDQLWAGSYHGGETSTSTRFAIDGQVFSMASGTIRVGKSFTIFQATNVTWPSTETLALKSETIVGDSQVQMFLTGIGDVVVETAYVGMNATQTSYQATTIPVYHGNVSLEDPALLGPTTIVRQIDPATGRAVTSEISEFEILNAPTDGGAVVDYATSAYAKFYPGWVHGSEQRITEIRAAFTHTFG